MKKLLLISFLSSLVLLNACGEKTNTTSPQISQTISKTTPQTQEKPEVKKSEPKVRPAKEEGFETYQSDELSFIYPDTYKIENSEDGKALLVLGDGAHVMIFKKSDYTEDELADLQIPEEKMHAGREVYGYELYLFYTDSTKDEIRAIADSVRVLQTYRNNANGFSVSFPQDWYFNFEKNDLNCMNPYELGAIESVDDCQNTLIQIWVYNNKEDSSAYLEEKTINKTEESYPVGDFLAERTFYMAGEIYDGAVYIVEFNGKFLVFDLASAEYLQDLEDIIKSLS
ncbi:hypothetical protein KKC94_01375 [Patescibacteria group bacterium]|nr:hypothetical protein [Patescibacteria group bacterium]